MIPLFKVYMNPTASQDVGEVLQSGMITQATKVEQFEAELKRIFNYPYILTLNSATSGLTLAMHMVKNTTSTMNSDAVNERDEVLTCPLTCTATNWSILANNMKLAWVDVDPATGLMDLNDLQRKLSSKTKTIMIVHWAGIPIDYARLNEILDAYAEASGYRVPVVEDCAHAFLSKYNDQYVGTFGNISVFSLQAIKHLTTGDGGLIFLPDEKSYKRAKLLRWFGIDREQKLNSRDYRMESDVAEFGFKYHMNDICATIGLSNLPGAIRNVQQHKDNANDILDFIGNNAESFAPNVRPLQVPKDADPAWWILTLRVKNNDGFIAFAKTKGVAVSKVHRRNDCHSCVDAYKTSLPNLDEYDKEYVSIPCGWWLTKDNIETIKKLLLDWNKLCCIRIRPLEFMDYYRNYLALYKQLNGVDLTNLQPLDFENVLEMNANQYYVIEISGKIVACGKLLVEEKFYDSVAHIEDVITDEEHRRLGLGTMMVNHLVELAKARKCYKVVLAAQDKNAKFYEHLGFSTDNREWKMYLNSSSSGSK